MKENSCLIFYLKVWIRDSIETPHLERELEDIAAAVGRIGSPLSGVWMWKRISFVNAREKTTVILST